MMQMYNGSVGVAKKVLYCCKKGCVLDFPR